MHPHLHADASPQHEGGSQTLLIASERMLPQIRGPPPPPNKQIHIKTLKYLHGVAMGKGGGWVRDFRDASRNRLNVTLHSCTHINILISDSPSETTEAQFSILRQRWHSLSVIFLAVGFITSMSLLVSMHPCI